MSSRMDGPLHRLLAVPLAVKIVVANSVAVVLAALLGFVRPPGSHLVGGAFLVLLALVAMGNALLVRLALGPLRSLERAARRVEAGALDTRVPPSPIADDEMRRLVAVFNAMLEGIAGGRRRERRSVSRLLDRVEVDRTLSARELLDDVAQTLSSLQVHLALLDQRRPGGDSRKEVELLRDGLRRALEQIRGIAVRLSPPELDHLGVGPALQAEARRLASTTGVPIRVEGIAPSGAVPPGPARSAFRLVTTLVGWLAGREGVEEVVVALEPGDGAVRIRLRGRGESPLRPGENGVLAELMDQAGLLGGSVRVGPAPPGVLELSVELPLDFPVEGPGS